MPTHPFLLRLDLSDLVALRNPSNTRTFLGPRVTSLPSTALPDYVTRLDGIFERDLSLGPDSLFFKVSILTRITL